MSLEKILKQPTGARFYRADLHIHSYGGSHDVVDESMTPEAIVNTAIQEKLDIIDYLIQTKYKTLLVCEIKFSQNPIGMSVINSVKDKIAKLVLPRGFAVVPILIHVGEVTDVVTDTGYFVNIIDLSKYLEKQMGMLSRALI